MAIYKYCENRDLVFTTKHYVGHFENEFLKLEGHTIIIFGSHLKGYAWDGCSPKWEWLDLYLGTPDGVVRKQEAEVLTEREAPDGGRMCEVQTSYVPKTYYASMVHDILRQYQKELPITVKTGDLIFLEFLQLAKFKRAKLYYRAVRTAYHLYYKWIY